MREYINLFYDLAKDSTRAEQYEYGFAMENVGSMINNVAHGIPSSEWLPKVYRAIEGNLAQPSVSDEFKRGWTDALEFLKSEIDLLER